MNYHKKVLSNGLRVLTVPMAGSESATLTVWANVGSRYETDKIAGLSHFLEHIVFKGTKKYPTAKDLSEALDSIGAEFNAGTSKEWTNFYVRSSVANLEKAFDVLSEMILNPLIKSEEVEREKGVILEEMAMYEDNPMADIGNVFEELIFDGNFLGKDTIGTKKSIKEMTQKDFVKYRLLHYFPKNMLITVSGGVTEKEVTKLTSKYFKFSHPERSRRITSKRFANKQTKPQFRLKKKKIEQAHVIIGFRAFEMGHRDRFAESILATILGRGMSSRLFIEVRERRGLAYSVHSDPESYTDAGYLGTYAGVDPKKCEEAIKVILEEHYALRDNTKPITKEELNKAKEYLKGHVALALENTSAVNQFFGERELLLGITKTPEEVFKELDKVTIEDCMRIAKKIIKKENLNMAIIGPYNSSEKFIKLLN